MLVWWSSRRVHAPLLTRGGLAPRAAELLAKLSPIVSVLLSIGAVAVWRLDNALGAAVVGPTAQGLPMLKLAGPKRAPATSLLLPTFMLVMPGFVESVSVAQSLAIKRPLSAPTPNCAGGARASWRALCRAANGMH